jgi:polyhydroxyalkanoate synthesis regulator phasin
MYNKGGNMDILKNAIELGLGAFVITREHAEKIANDLVKKGKLNKKSGEDLIAGMIKKGKSQEKAIQAGVEKAVRSALTHLNLASKADVRRLEKEVEKLKARMK